MNKKKLSLIIGMLILVLLTFGLRLLFVKSALWYDEACSWYSAKQDFPFGIIDNLLTLDLQHTPLYFFLLHFWMKIFGNSEIALKSFSVIPSVLTVWLTFIVTKKLTNNNFTSICATTIAAVNPILVYFSTEVRMYPLVVFLVLLSTNYLIDFEKNGDKKTLSKLVFTNILIPYTLVGGILYNISVMLTYPKYLCKKSKQQFHLYLKGILIEIFALIPYFLMIFYYAKMRSAFVIKHEGALSFMHIIDVIRNFFATNIASNVYWPNTDPVYITFGFTMLIVVPCAYFICGIIKGTKQSEGFLKVLYKIFLICFALFALTAALQIHIFTTRYILYTLPPFIILSVIALLNNLKIKHFLLFITFYTIASIYGTLALHPLDTKLKEAAFKAVKLEADRLNLGINDIVIMPFGSDAPYYFKNLEDVQLFRFDFHKEMRNPNNNKCYDENTQKALKQNTLQTIYDKIFEDKEFSTNHHEYFKQKVSDKVPKGNYAVVALYGEDVNSLVTLPQLRKNITKAKDIKTHETQVMFEKYLYDIRYFLAQDFNFITRYTKDNYTYLIYQKK